MKKIWLVLFMLLLTSSLAYGGWVRGYTRSDGTYVQGYYHSDSNESNGNASIFQTTYEGASHSLDGVNEIVRQAQDEEQKKKQQQAEDRRKLQEDYISLAEKGIVPADPNDTETFAIPGLPGRFKRIK